MNEWPFGNSYYPFSRITTTITLSWVTPGGDVSTHGIY